MGWGEGASRMKESEKLFSVEMQVGHKETENLAARHKAVPTLPKSQRKRREGGGGENWKCPLQINSQDRLQNSLWPVKANRYNAIQKANCKEKPSLITQATLKSRPFQDQKEIHHGLSIAHGKTVASKRGRRVPAKRFVGGREGGTELHFQGTTAPKALPRPPCASPQAPRPLLVKHGS